VEGKHEPADLCERGSLISRELLVREKKKLAFIKEATSLQ